MNLRNPERGLFSIKGILFSLGLVASFIFVGVFYEGLIRPSTDRAALAQSLGVDSAQSPSSLFVILKDYEQQICLSLLVWGIMLVAYKFALLRTEGKALDRFAPENGNTAKPEVDLLCGQQSIGREQAGMLSDEIDRKSKSGDLRDNILPYVMARGLGRFHMTGSVPEATETIMGRIEVASEQQESELSMLRYLVWAIPSIGFIGTVRGIGVALRRADEALKGDISGVTSALGVAFNSTLVALIISIFLMLLIHLLQSSQEGLILRLQSFCREQLIDKLYDNPKNDEAAISEAPESDADAKTVALDIEKTTSNAEI